MVGLKGYYFCSFSPVNRHLHSNMVGLKEKDVHPKEKDVIDLHSNMVGLKGTEISINKSVTPNV